MKKVMLYFFVIIAIIMFAGCTTNTMRLINNNLAEVRYTIFSGSNEYVFANFMCGKREEPYVMNGEANSLIDFGVFTIKCKNFEDISDVKYKAIIDGKEFSGTMEKNPYELYTYVCDIKYVTELESDIELFYSINNVGNTIVLFNESSKWNVNHNKALKIASVELKDFINKNTIKQQLQAEVYIKIAQDTTGELKPYYWFIQILATDGGTSQVVIDPFSEEVLVKTLF